MKANRQIIKVLTTCVCVCCSWRRWCWTTSQTHSWS